MPIQLDPHKAAVAKAYGLAAGGYNKPALQFFSQGAEALAALLDQAGMTHIEVREVKIGYLLPDAEAWWDICWNSGFRGPLAQLREADLQQFKAEHLREVEALRGRDGIFFDGTTFVAKGQMHK